jgi:signal peptide peptidase SppA
MSSNLLAHIADRVLNRPLMILPEKLAMIAQVLGGRIGIEPAAFRRDRSAALPADTRRGGSPYARTKDGVAVIPVVGTLVNRSSFIGAESGLLSYRGIIGLAAHAASDPQTAAVLLDMDSPGGEAVGAFEAADAVRALAAKKPVVAVVNGMAASAAYAIASAASTIVSIPTGVSGSIGVVMLHADYSGALDKAGIVPTLIDAPAGGHKVDGNPYEKLPAAVREDLQREVDQFYSLFVSAVAKGRVGLSEAAIRATKARVYIGEDALKAGLVDEIGSFESALADLSRSVRHQSTPALTAASATPPALTGTATMSSEAERERIKSILALQHHPVHRSAVESLAFNTTLPPDEAKAIIASFPAPAGPMLGRAGSTPLGLFTADDDKAAVAAAPHLGLLAAKDQRNGDASVWDDVIVEQNKRLNASRGASPKGPLA